MGSRILDKIDIWKNKIIILTKQARICSTSSTSVTYPSKILMSRNCVDIFAIADNTIITVIYCAAL